MGWGSPWCSTNYETATAGHEYHEPSLIRILKDQHNLQFWNRSQPHNFSYLEKISSPTPGTSPPPRTTSPSRTSSSPRTPPGFPPTPVPPSQPTDDDPKGVTKDEFKQLMSEHFKLMNLDTASIITNALKPIERAFDEADRMLDKHLAKQKNSWLGSLPLIYAKIDWLM